MLKTEKSPLLQVAGLEVLEISSTLQWDYKEKCILQDKVILKFKEKKTPNLYLFQELGKATFLDKKICDNCEH